MGEKKKLRTVAWKHQQLMNSIKALYKEKLELNALKKERKNEPEASESSE